VPHVSREAETWGVLYGVLKIFKWLIRQKRKENEHLEKEKQRRTNGEKSGKKKKEVF